MMNDLNQMSYSLPAEPAAEVNRVVAAWQSGGYVRRLWEGDSSLWTGRDEHNWLGWLRIVEDQLATAGRFTELAAEVKATGFSNALLLGMGGSSLSAEVLRMTFGTVEGFPDLHVLDSTDPAQVLAAERRVKLDNTLFIVASKSGTTLEPAIFQQYFFRRVQQQAGAGKAGERFLAITDPGSQLAREATAAGFRRILYGVPEIGGRFSALSDFGMAPAAVMGIDVPKLLRRARVMVEACSPGRAAEENPGVTLGVILGVLARNGRNKLTLIASPGISALGAWLEQLLAESTGKQGRAIIPVDQEPPVSPEIYGGDRLFAYIRLESAPDAAQDAAVAAIEESGKPVVRISVGEPYGLGQEFFRWEIATAVAAAILGINPFDQPDVVFSKVETKKLIDAYEKAGAFPPEEPILEEQGIRLYADPVNAGALSALAGGDRTLAGYLRAHLNRITPGDYFALLAYLERNKAHQDILQRVRRAVLESKRAATCLGFGPRFLHSTGQAYKAGPNVGVFLQITCEDAAYLGVPGRKCSFGAVKAAQARGDFQVLAGRCRRALRIHLGPDVAAGLERLEAAVRQALG